MESNDERERKKIILLIGGKLKWELIGGNYLLLLRLKYECFSSLSFDSDGVWFEHS